MKKWTLLIFISFFINSSAFANPSKFIVTASELTPIGKNYFKDHDGRIINYPCQAGGEPLVIYSSVDGKAISSQAVLNPVYLKEGYQATQLYIPALEMTEAQSLQDLMIQATNPAYAFITFNLSRMNGKTFYVHTAIFPVVESKSTEGDAVKFVSLFNVNINQSPDTFKTSAFPIYNNNNDESKELGIYSDVSEITANLASWNQTTRWSFGEKRYYSNVAYRFSPVKANTNGATSYNGYGFWICGSDQKSGYRYANK